MGLGKLGWGWPLLSTLILRWTQQKKKATWLVSLLCFSELPGQAGKCLWGPVQALHFCCPDAGVDSGLLFTLSYYFGLRPGLFADGASKHSGGVICQQWVACRELSVVLLQLHYRFILSEWHLDQCMGLCSSSDLWTVCDTGGLPGQMRWNQEFLFTTKHWHVHMVEDVLGLEKKWETTFLSLFRKGEASEGETGKR